MMELEQQQSYENSTASRTASGIPLKDPDSIKLFVGQVMHVLKYSGDIFNLLAVLIL